MSKKSVFSLKAGYGGVSTVIAGRSIDISGDSTYSTSDPEEVEALRELDALKEETSTSKEK